MPGLATLAAGSLLALAMVAGCMHGTFHPTPCKPAGEPTHGTLRVQLPLHVGEPGRTTSTAGKCVGLYAGDDHELRATARIGDDGNATLALPVQGQVLVRWQHPWPGDSACANEATAYLSVPGPTNVTLETGGVCY